jgi:hypothetical protein
MLWWFVGIWVVSGAVMPMWGLLDTVAGGARLTDRDADGGLVAAELHDAAPSAAQSACAGRQPALVRAFGPLPWLWRQITAAPATIGARRVGRGMLAGLAGIAALLVLLLGSFSVTMPDLATETAASNSVTVLPETTVAIAAPFGAVSAEPPVTRMTDGETAAVPRDAPTESAGTTEQYAAVPVRQDDTSPPGAATSVDNAAPPAQEAKVPLTGPTALPAQRSRGSRHANQLVERPNGSRWSRGTWLFAPNPNAGANS